MPSTFSALPIYLLTAVLEIAGCFAFWAWLRLDKPIWWLVPGVISLIGFAWALTRVDTLFAGRAFAAYGGIYILSSLGWMWAVENHRPDRWDVVGSAVCVVGAGLILYGPRPS